MSKSDSSTSFRAKKPSKEKKTAVKKAETGDLFVPPPDPKCKTSTPKKDDALLQPWDVSQITQSSGATGTALKKQVKKKGGQREYTAEELAVFQKNEQLLAFLADKFATDDLEQAKKRIEEDQKQKMDLIESKKKLLASYERDIEMIKCLKERGEKEERDLARLDQFGDIDALIVNLEKVCRDIEYSKSVLEVRNIDHSCKDRLEEILQTTKENVQSLVADSSHFNSVAAKVLDATTNFNQDLSAAQVLYEKCEKKLPQVKALTYHESSMKATISKRVEEVQEVTSSRNLDSSRRTTDGDSRK